MTMAPKQENVERTPANYVGVSDNIDTENPNHKRVTIAT